MSELANDMSGVALLADWLGDHGDPVHPILAESRASYCVKCPQNVEPKWWERVKSAIAGVIRGQLALKHGMNLTTRHDDDLHMCRACGCCMKLKVWVPRDHVRKHTPRDALNKMPKYMCWVRKELEGTQ